jgi:hypothetical protein
MAGEIEGRIEVRRHDGALMVEAGGHLTAIGSWRLRKGGGKRHL